MADSEILSKTFETFDDGLIVGWTLNISFLPGRGPDALPGWIKQSSSVSMSSSGPVETASYLQSMVYEFKKRIILSGALQAVDTMYDNLEATMGSHQEAVRLTHDSFHEKVSKNITDPVTMVQEVLGISLQPNLSTIFSCIAALKPVIEVTQSLSSQFAADQTLSIDSIFRLMYGGMGIRIIIPKDSSSPEVTDLLFKVSAGSGGGTDIPGESIMSFSESLDNTQLPTAYVMSVGVDGVLKATAPNASEHPAGIDNKKNRSNIFTNHASQLSASFNPVKAINFGFFRYTSLTSVNSSNIVIADNGIAKVSLDCSGGQSEIELQLSLRSDRVTDDFTKTPPSAADYDYAPIQAILFNMLIEYFQMVTYYETMYQAHHASVVLRGEDIVKVWETVEIGEVSIEGAALDDGTPETFTYDPGAKHIVVSVREIEEGGLIRSIVRYVRMDQN